MLPSDTQLEAYLDDVLPEDELRQVEDAIRSSFELQQRLREIIQRRDKGIHSLGAIWRRRRLSCPSREQLALLLAGLLPDPLRTYIAFHVSIVGCFYCQANLKDLQETAARHQQSSRQRLDRLYASGVQILESHHRSGQ